MTAFKAKEMDKKNFLGLLKSEIIKAESRPDFDGDADKTAIRVVNKMKKSLLELRGEGIRAEEEIEYIKPYLPKMIGEEEIVAIVREMIDGGIDSLGLIMREFNAAHAGMADNKLVKDVALELL